MTAVSYQNLMVTSVARQQGNNKKIWIYLCALILLASRFGSAVPTLLSLLSLTLS